jgi:excisionase family DNA binding protein
MVTREELPDRLTVKETADMLGVSPTTIKVMISRGELKYIGEVGNRDVLTDSIVEYVNRRFGGGKS